MHAAESTHWYTRDGEPAYTVTAKAGHKRPTTLADARKMNLVPSVTTIIKCAVAPGLERWKREQTMLSALTLPREAGELEPEWLYRVERDSQEQARKAAERGTAIHAAIQGYYESTPYIGFEPYVDSAERAVENWFGGAFWYAEASFAHQFGFGGKVDLNSTGAVVDFKTKEFDKNVILRTWDEHAMQLAAYRFGMNKYVNRTARCAIVYVSTTVPGLAKLIEIPESDLVKGWGMFTGLLDYWKAKNGFDSSFYEAAA